MRQSIKELKTHPATKPVLIEAGLTGENFLKMSEAELKHFWNKQKQCQKAFPTDKLFLNFWAKQKKNR